MTQLIKQWSFDKGSMSLKTRLLCEQKLLNARPVKNWKCYYQTIAIGA